MVLSGVTELAVANIVRYSVGHHLSEPELRQYRALRGACGRDFLSGRVALKAALHRYGVVTDRVVAQLVIENAPNGQPRVAGQMDLCCSLAHSCSWGVGAVAARPIGIDIERVRPRRPELLWHIADEKERVDAAIDNGDDDQLITKIWTVKEAVLKGMGVGLAVPPKQLRLSKAGTDLFLVDILASVRTQYSSWKVSTYAVDGFWIAVATEEETHVHTPISWYHSPDVSVADDAAIGA